MPRGNGAWDSLTTAERAEELSARAKGDDRCGWVSPDGEWVCVAPAHEGEHGPLIGVAPIPPADLERARKMAIERGWDKVEP